MWDATLFGLFNEDFPLYIKHEDLSEIAHGGQCQSISITQLWIRHMTETSMRAENVDVYGYLEPHIITYIDLHYNAHWQMVVILPNENVVIWFCLLHNRPDNYLKGIINSALKGLDDTQQSKSKPTARWIVVKCNRQKGSTECGYYVMHWIPLEPKRLKALHIQWSKYYLKVPNVEVETEANTEVEDSQFELTMEFAEVMDHIPLTQQSQPFLRDLSTFPDAIQKDMLILSMFWGNP
ncbi:hypothetical protein HKD37_03G007073 [Glycine soja]